MTTRRVLLNKTDLLVIEIEKGAYNINNKKAPYIVEYEVKEGSDIIKIFHPIQGYWGENLKILGTLFDLSEQKCVKCVDKIELQKGTIMTDGTVLDKNYVIGYKNYFKGNHYYPHECFSAKESFISFLQSKNIDISKELLIIERMGYIDE